jgi:hypothetical protein
MRRALREAMVKHRAPFYILFFGVLCFGGGLLLWDICYGVFADHKPLVSLLTIESVVAHLLGGLFWGSFMWYVVGVDKHYLPKQNEPNDKHLPK